MIVHFMNNALSVYLTFASVRGLGFANIVYRVSGIIQSNAVVGIIFTFSLVTLLLYALVWLTRMLFISSIKQKIIENKKDAEAFIKRQVFLIGEDGFVDVANSDDFKYVERDLSQLLGVKRKTKRDKYALAFMILSFVMMSVLTIFTFVWGVI